MSAGAVSTVVFNEAELKKALADAELSQGRLLLGVLSRVGFQTVAFLRSLTEESRPPVRKTEGPRQAHPGHWADISGDLARGYRFEVKDGAGNRITRAVEASHTAAAPFELELFNDMEYAAYLEALEAYWVLSGLEQPGSPVRAYLKQAVDAIPGWKWMGGAA